MAIPLGPGIMTNDELLHKWINGKLSESELIKFKQRPEYESLRELYKQTEDLAAPSFDQDQMLANVLKSKAAAPPIVKTKPPSKIFSLLKYSVAASVLILAGWMLFAGLNSEVVIQLAKGERQDGQLPDQSTFVLNAESRLSYEPKSWPEERELELEGEAFFKVMKGSRFAVQTPNGVVQVLGTQFNVWSRGNTLEVSCRSGKVAVRTEDGRITEELTPKQALRLVDGQLADRWTLSAAQENNWVEGISSFKKVPLARVLDELERQFDIRIDRTQVDLGVITSCNFEHQDLNMALKTSLGQMNIEYKINKDKTVYLSKKE